MFFVVTAIIRFPVVGFEFVVDIPNGFAANDFYADSVLQLTVFTTPSVPPLCQY